VSHRITIALIALAALGLVACSSSTTKSSSKSSKLTKSERDSLRERCNADDAKACKRLGKMWSRKDGLDARAKAREYYAKACALGHRTSCLLREVANPVEPQMVEKLGDHVAEADLAQYQRYCLGGEEDYCNALAYYLWEEDAEENDIWVLRRSLAVACVKGMNDFCSTLSTTLDRGFGGFERDPNAAYWIADYACDKREHGPSCHYKGVAYQAGEGVEADEEKSSFFVMKACELDFQYACGDAANVLRTGQGNWTKDLERGLDLARSSCRDDVGNGCRSLGYYYLSGEGVNKSIRRGLNHLKKGCELEEARACVEAGRVIEETNVEPTARAFELYRKGEKILREECERRRNGLSCGWLAHLYATSNLENESRYTLELLRERACRLDARVCGMKEVEEDRYEGTL
jgi:TPR repeat protein